MKKTEEAFKWIIGILKGHGVPFKITGGFAARLYGSDRPLADIDIDILNEKFDEVLPEVNDYIIWGPERLLDNNWDLLLMTLQYGGQKIDICGAEGKLRNHKTGEWKNFTTDFSKSETKEVYGILVPVITREDLIEYKQVLGRDVDRQDVEALTQS